MKRIHFLLTLALSSMLIFSLLANFSVFAEEFDPSGEYENFGYELLDDGTIEITAFYYYENDAISISIPDKIQNIKVTGIGSHAFMMCDSIKSVNIPEGVEYIGEGAFEMCNDLESVSLPNSLENIGELAFYDCGKLKKVTIPKNVTNIGEKAFGYYYNDWEESKVPDFHINCYMASAGEKYMFYNIFEYTLLDAVNLNYGDANCDSKVTAADVLVIRKSIAGQELTFGIVASDVNCDRKITTSDVLLIRKKIAGQNIILGT